MRPRIKVGFDLDGVLASFVPTYTQLLIDHTGENRFGNWETDPEFPCVWDYEEAAGYTKEERDKCWDALKDDPNFWRDLPPLPGARTVATAPGLGHPEVEVYFITTRFGRLVKDQCEQWCHEHLGFRWPTVLVSKHKGSLCAALGIDCFLDDKLENVEGIMQVSPSTRAYLLDASWNRKQKRPAGLRVVGSVEEYLSKEGLL